MRTLVLIPLALLTGGCWTPGPSQVDPTLYPWHSVTRKAPEPTILPIPRAEAPQPEYCVVMIEQPRTTGIRVGGRSPVALSCATPTPAPAAESTEPEGTEEEIWIMCGPPPEARKRHEDISHARPSCGL